jgi:sarcosine oxidase subunit beta
MAGKHTDVVVVGAGIVGTATAFHLARAGVDVTVVDKGGVAAGATGVSSGFVRVHVADWDFCLLCKAGWEELTHWEDVVGRPTPFVRTGSANLVPAEDADRAQAAVARLQAEGVPCEVLDAGQLGELHPSVTWPEDAVAVWEPEGGYATPGRCATQYLERVGELGGTVRLGPTVTGLTTSGDRVTGVETSDGPIAAGTVVVATGAWAATTGLLAGLELPVRSRHIVEQRLTVTPDPETLPLYIDLRKEELLVRRDGPGALLVGAEVGDWDVDPDALPPADQDTLATVRQRFRQRLGPPFATTLEKVKMGADGFTPDNRPLIDTWPERAGLHVAIGLNGIGFKASPAIGGALATWITTGERPPLVAPFAVDRLLPAGPA